MITCFNARFAKKTIYSFFWLEETVHCFTRDVFERLQQQQNEKSIEAFNQKVELIPLKLNSI